MLPRRAAVALITTALALALLLSFKTPSEQGTGSAGPRSAAVALPTPTSATTRVTTRVPAATAPPARNAPSPATQPPAPSATDAPATTTTDGQLTGPVVSTRYGPVQVQVTMQQGKIIDVTALELPTGRRSGQISNEAAPLLREEALQAQSAAIDILSGATYTSEAYAQSLQGALDQAHG